MTKIAGALNMLPKTILNKTITNESTNEVIKIYQADRNYPKFYRNFLTKSDNGRDDLCLDFYDVSKKLIPLWRSS
jgi:hypothetical protein